MAAMTSVFTDVLARKRIAAARSDMILDEPFFGALALRLKLVEEIGCGTAWTDGVHLGYDPRFIATLKSDELGSLVKHEVMHCSNGHPWRRDGRTHERFNEAADYAINPIIVQAGGKLGAGWLFDPQYIGKSAEWIYDRLPAAPQNPQGSSSGLQSPQAGVGQSSSSPGSQPAPPQQTQEKQKSSKPAPTQAGKAAAQNGSKQPSPPGEVRDAPTEGEDGEAVPTQEDWRQATIQAAMLAKGQGKLPAGMERYITQVTKPRVDWRSATRRFAQEVSRADYSFVRPNPRYVAHGRYMPALRSHEIGDLAVGVDTSGSVDDVLLGQFGAEIQAIADEVKPRSIRVLYCDARVNREVKFERGDEIKLSACGGGGTDFRPVFDAIEKWDEPPVAVIYLTDLAGTFPEEAPEIPVLWVTPENDSRDQHVPFGELVTA